MIYGGVLVAASVWKGSIVLSLISIPIQLFAAARSERTYLHQIHRDCNTRVKQPLFCPTCNRFVDRAEIIKGYEFDEGQYVLMEDKDVKKLAATSSRSLEILAFSKLSEIDPIFFDASYFCVPEDAGKKAYQLLVKALEDTGTVGIGKLIMHQRDYTVFLRAYQHGLILHTMYFKNELHEANKTKSVSNTKFTAKEMDLARRLIATLASPFKPELYKDEYRENIERLIAQKRKGREVKEVSQPKPEKVVDILDALKRSLENHPRPSKVSAKKKTVKHKGEAA